MIWFLFQLSAVFHRFEVFPPAEHGPARYWGRAE